MSTPVIDPMGAADDAGLPQLRAALDPVVAERALLRCLPPSYTQDRCRLRSIEVLRHKPGRRCLVAYELEWPTSQNIVRQVLLGKIRAKGLDRRTFDLVTALHDGGWDENSGDEISVPRALAILPELAMWLQPKMAGESAASLLLRPGGNLLAGRLAEALAKLHRTIVGIDRKHTIADELGILEDRLSRVAREQPSWAPRLANMVRRCRDMASLLPARAGTGIHRDFYPDQALVCGARLYLLDFDLYCQGDPALDAGNFLAHMAELALRQRGSAAALADREQVFFARYRQLSGHQQLAAVQIYRLLSLMRHIYISTLFAERRVYTRSWVDMCERQLSAWERSGSTLTAEVQDGLAV